MNPAQASRVLTEAKCGVDDTAESRETSVRYAAQERVAAGEPKARVKQALSNLLPLPGLHRSLVVAGVVAHYPSASHRFLFWSQPSHFRRGSKEQQA